MFKRDILTELKVYTQFPVIALLGPRQSGKTTLVKHVFKKYTYISFENLHMRALAQEDPRAFLQAHDNKNGIIIDEFQYVPEILSYIQLEVDEKHRPGFFILTGSQNFLMNQAITQSLAGRVGILTLLPLSIHEITKNGLGTYENAYEYIFNGGYPRVYQEHLMPHKLYPSYIQSYIERDVRLLTNVGDLRSFQRFMLLCAGRIGQQLNLSELACSCGVSVSTAQRWISILEASYIIFLLQPYFKNFNKRLTKTPKIYFYDTGIACSLLGIEDLNLLSLHPLKGHIFENFILADICKQYFNTGKKPPLYFWRDLNGRLEIDGLLEYRLHLYPIEIKSAELVSQDAFKNIEQWSTLANIPHDKRFVVYGGSKTIKRSTATLLRWKDAGILVKKIQKK